MASTREYTMLFALNASLQNGFPATMAKANQSINLIQKSINDLNKQQGNIRSFEKVARKYSITYSLKKDRSTTPPRYLVFFRAKDVDVMTAAFREYTGSTLTADKKRSIRKRLQKAIGISASKHREREKVKEKTRSPEL